MDLSKLFEVQERVESGGNPLAVSPKGAKGPMQTMPTTLKDPGYGVLPAKDDSIDEQRRVGRDYMTAMLREYKNDLPTALAAYNWGPGKVNEWKAKGGDPAKLPKGTQDYIRKIAGDQGVVSSRREQVVAESNRISAGVQGLILKGPTQSLQQAGRETEQFQRTIKEESRPSSWEQFGAAVAGNTDNSLLSGITERLFRPEFEPVDGFVPNLKDLPESADRDLIDDYKEAVSPEAAARILDRYTEEQGRTQAVMDRGTGKGLALSLAAEGASVTNWVTAYAAPAALARMGMGSVVLAAEGRAAASVGSAIAENVLSGTAIEAANQMLKGKFDATALLVSMTADSLIGGATGLHGVRMAERLADAGGEAAAARVVELARKAEQEIGTTATSGELRAVMERIEAQEMQGVVKAMTDPVPPEAMLMRAVPERTPGDGVPLPVNEVPMPGSRFATAEQLAQREADLAAGGKYSKEWERNTEGLIKSADEFYKQGPGVHTLGEFPADAKLGIETATKLAKAFLPEHTISLTFSRIPMADGRFANGTVVQAGRKGAMIRIDPTMAPSQIIRSMAHEMGHVVFSSNLSKAKIKDLRALTNAWKEFAAEALGTSADGNKARGMRFSTLHVDQGASKEFTPKLKGDYELDYDEYLAEQFVKYLEKDVATDNKFGFTRTVVGTIKQALAKAIAFLTKFGREVPNADVRVEQFLDDLLVKMQAENGPATTDVAQIADGPSQATVPAKPAAVVNELLTDPDAMRFGLTTLPMGTATERKNAQAILALHKQAASWAERNPMDAAWQARVQNLADNNVFNVASNGLVMLKSPNPLVRMIASELLEDASGVAGKRRATAAISKWMYERKMLGNAINDVQGAFSNWGKNKPGFLKDNLIGGKYWDSFNKEVAAEIEARGLAGQAVSTDGNIKSAADSLEAAYQRTANAQREVKTLGHEGLPETSRGYMPHRMNPKAVIALTNEQNRILHSALTEQFITIEGWDMSFSDQLASAYIKRVRDRASGDYGSTVGGGNPSTASMVEEALRGMDLPEDTIKNHMAKFTKGAANFTKGRIELDLNRVYSTEAGEFKLLDIFETNQIELLRQQVGRASGEVALTKFGVTGKPGLKLLRDAMQYGEDGARTGLRENEAFDQMAAEFLNEPFGTQSGKFMERAMAANTLVRLGGIAFNQIAESINGIVHVGVGRTMASIGDLGRLRKEVKTLAAGGKIDNPFLGSIELAGGAEFGTDAYKVVMPFDSADNLYPTYGQDTLTVTDRLLRGGGHLQAKLSGWRMIHSAQQRGMAEQIVHKMMRYVREGKDDVALRQFGITPEIQAALKGELGNIATFDGKGNLTRFDVTKITDPDIREQVIQSVWRGTAQIIQGTFIGERGKWAHDGWLKLLTQFRTFSITSMEKQWGRQRNSRGATAAFGILLGSMSIAVPIYMARVYANSIGRPDADQYIEDRMAPQHLARATLNYVTASGLSGDFIDLVTATLPDSMGLKPTGGRAGVESSFVGNYVAPSLSLVDDIWKYAQSPTEVDELAKLFPGSRLPYLLPLVNATKD